MNPNFEYKVTHLDEDDLDVLESKLNSLGQEGWELVSFDGEVGIMKRKQLYLTNLYTESSNERPRPQNNS